MADEIGTIKSREKKANVLVLEVNVSVLLCWFRRTAFYEQISSALKRSSFVDIITQRNKVEGIQLFLLVCDYVFRTILVKGEKYLSVKGHEKLKVGRMLKKINNIGNRFEGSIERNNAFFVPLTYIGWPMDYWVNMYMDVIYVQGCQISSNLKLKSNCICRKCDGPAGYHYLRLLAAEVEQIELSTTNQSGSRGDFTN